MNGQQTFEVPKAKLLEILKANRDTHQKDFELASEGFRELVIGEMKDNLQIAEEGGEIALRSVHVEPTLHVEEYDNVIGLLELTTDTMIDISWTDYKQYVKDEWHWKNHWEVSNSLYSTAALRAR